MCSHLPSCVGSRWRVTAPHVSAARADASGTSTTAIGGGFHLLPHNLGVLLGSTTVVSSPSPTLLRIHRNDRWIVFGA